MQDQDATANASSRSVDVEFCLAAGLVVSLRLMMAIKTASMVFDKLIRKAFGKFTDIISGNNGRVIPMMPQTGQAADLG